MSIERLKSSIRDLFSSWIIEHSDFFDKKYYLERYPDAAKSGKSPVNHYVQNGAHEGYNPSSVFNTEFYLSEYPEVRVSGMNPLLHYILHGKKEGRKMSAESLSCTFGKDTQIVLILASDAAKSTVCAKQDFLINAEKNLAIYSAKYVPSHEAVRVSTAWNNMLVVKEQYLKLSNFLGEMGKIRFSEIVVKSLVGWHSAKEVLSFLKEYKNENRETKISFEVHDYYFVCPSYKLLDVNNKPCNVRNEETECKMCIKCNGNESVVRDRETTKDYSVSGWRNMWNNFFDSAVDEVTVFSESSKNIIENTYPGIAEKIVSIPLAKPEKAKCTRVAVFSDLSKSGGAEVVRDLCVFLDENKIKDIQLFLYGRNDAKLQSPHLKQLDSCSREELMGKLDEKNIDIVFIPTVFPEANSNAIEEYLLLPYPVMCFDIGAQAEAARNGNGIVLYQEDPLYLCSMFKKIDGAAELSDATKPVSSESMLQKTIYFQDNFSRDFLEYLFSYRDDKSCFVSESSDEIILGQGMPKIIAFYLPQFHDFPENVKWFGRGFSEWTNTSQTVPQFIGHNQPQIPIDVGYYSLNDTSAMYRQAELARKYGIAGFAVYYYWFSGEKLMEQPLRRLLEDKTLDFPFFLFWANENWSRLWGNGADQEILHKIELIPGDAKRFMEDALPYMKDPRYIRIHNKPVLIIYKLKAFPKKDYLNFIDEIQKIAKKNGLEGLYISGIIESWMDPNNLEKVQDDYCLDAITEFSSTMGRDSMKQMQQLFADPQCSSCCYDVEEYVRTKKYLRNTKANLFAGLFTNWDNSPRKYHRGATILQSSPENYKEWLANLIRWTYENHDPEERFIFVNAWNEWAESAHLEPDTKYGYAYLQKTREALEENIPV